MSSTGISTPTVFISYRRSETGGHAGRLYDTMVARFGEGNVFMDVELQPGIDFVDRITAVVAACHVLLVVMGPDWARPPPGETLPRIADPEDFVRLEVAAALGRDDVTVIPLLVEAARMPKPDALPEALRALTRRNALELSDVGWRNDVGRLLDVMETLLKDTSHPAPVKPPTRDTDSAPPGVPAAGVSPPGMPAKASSLLRSHPRIALGAAAVALVTLLLLVIGGGSDKPSTTSQPSSPPAANTGSDLFAPVRATCKDVGLTGEARDIGAQGASDCNAVIPYDNATGVHGASLTYFTFADAAAADTSLQGSKTHLTGTGFKACEQSLSARLDSGDAWCLRNPDTGRIGISWRDGADGIGAATFDKPTTVTDAVRAWQQLVPA